MAHYQRGRAGGYTEIRTILAPEYRRLPDTQIETLLAESAIDAAELESFLGTLKKIGRGVTQALPAVLPVAGTVVGTAFGGPLGATIGGAVGNLAGQAIGQATAPGGQPGRQAGRPRPGAPGMPALPAGGSPAAAQLLQVIQRPEIMQALMAMVMGQSGRRSMPVAGASVPTAAFTNLIGTLANRATAEYSAAVSAPAEGAAYLYDYAGEALADPAVAEQRAARLLELLHEADLGEEPAEEPEAAERYDEAALLYDAYDEADLYELYSTPEAW